jgi:hypothetical protein
MSQQPSQQLNRSYRLTQLQICSAKHQYPVPATKCYKEERKPKEFYA